MTTQSYATGSQTEWVKSGASRLRPRYPGETLWNFQRDPAGYLETLAREHGDLVRFRLGPIDTFLVNHPTLIKEVLVTQNRNFRLGQAHQQVRHFFGDGLVTSEGDIHLRERRLIEPMFHAPHIYQSADTAVEFAARWGSAKRPNQVLEVGHEMWALTLEIICKTLFNTSVKSEIDEISRAIYDVTRVFSPVTMLLADWLLRLHLPPSGQFRRARARLDQTMFRIIREHQLSGNQGDLLSMLLAAHETENGINLPQVRDELLTFFVAGHGTTALMLTWVFCLLAQNLKAERRLHQELQDVLGGRNPTMHDQPKLPYTRAVLTEALRLYPPAWGMDRQVARECTLGGQTLPKGALVLISQWVTHHDARFFPEPYRFDPERWLAAAPPKYAFFPFSAGPRVCVGEGMTWMNGALILATIAQQWRLTMLPGQQITPAAGTSLAPQDGVMMRLEKRN